MSWKHKHHVKLQRYKDIFGIFPKKLPKKYLQIFGYMHIKRQKAKNKKHYIENQKIFKNCIFIPKNIFSKKHKNMIGYMYIKKHIKYSYQKHKLFSKNKAYLYRKTYMVYSQKHIKILGTLINYLIYSPQKIFC